MWKAFRSIPDLFHPRRVWRFLIRLDVASILFLFTLLVILLGSCFPQRPEAIETTPELHTLWQEEIHDRYGGLAKALNTIGTFHIFRTPFFIALAVVLALITLICTIDRLKSVWRRAFHRQIRCSDATFDTAQVSATVIASPEEDHLQVVQETLTKRGFRVRSIKEDEAIHLRGDRYQVATAATLVSHLGVVILAIGVLLSSGLGWRETLIISPDNPAPITHRQSWMLGYEGFEIERRPDQSVAGYNVEVTLSDVDDEGKRGIIGVNEPMSYRGVAFYLQGFGRGEDGIHVFLVSVFDPGYSLVILAGSLILFGFTISLYFPHSCVHARIDPDGTVRLAGRTDRERRDFPQEFASLTDEIARDLKAEKLEAGSIPC